MEFFFLGLEPIAVQIPGDYIKFDIYPSPNVQRCNNEKLVSFLLSDANPRRDLFKAPEEMEAALAVFDSPMAEKAPVSKKSKAAQEEDVNG